MNASRPVARLRAALIALAATVLIGLATSERAASAAVTARSSAGSGLAFSFHSNRSAPQSLSGKNLSDSGQIYVYLPYSALGPLQSVSMVRWYLDDPTMLKPAWMTERRRSSFAQPKFDLNGSRRSGAAAIPFALGSVADTSHTITAAVVHTDGSVKLVSARFSVHAAGRSSYRRLAFDDEFNGRTLNAAKWTAYKQGVGNDGFGQRSPSALRISHGQLVLTASNNSGSVVSEGLQTKQSFLYGQYQFRIRTQYDPSHLTSGIFLIYATSGVYAEGEDDFYETLKVRDPVYIFLHALVPMSTPTVQDYFNQNLNATRWISETVDLTPHAFTIFRNGVKIWRDTNPHVIPVTPHTIHIQLDDTAVGQLRQPVSMYVSYVRFYH